MTIQTSGDSRPSTIQRGDPETSLLVRLEKRYGPVGDPVCTTCGATLDHWADVVDGGSERREIWRCPIDKYQHPSVSIYPVRRDKDVLTLVRTFRDRLVSELAHERLREAMENALGKIIPVFERSAVDSEEETALSLAIDYLEIALADDASGCPGGEGEER